jgi:hypothetical protein
MAFDPCSFDGKGYKGPANTFFPALVSGGQSFRARLKVCPAHTVQLLELADKCQLASRGDEFFSRQALLACSGCGGDLGERPWGFFLNVYVRKQPEEQRYGQICDGCAPSWAGSWLIPW